MRYRTCFIPPTLRAPLAQYLLEHPEPFSGLIRRILGTFLENAGYTPDHVVDGNTKGGQ